MSGPGELDRPGTPESAGAWDERSHQWTPVRTEPPVVSADTGPGEAFASARRQPSPRRTAADPVKALMHRHRELCERAVDPLEIAAGLEAHGVTDRTAARFRHRDVFSLAEEMYARATHDGEPPTPPTAVDAPRVRPAWVLFTLLPGALATATAAALHLTHGQARLAAATTGVLTVALALRAALSRGPLAPTDRTPPGPTPHAPLTRTWTYWLIAYALLGDGLLHASLTGGPDGPPTGTADTAWPLATAPVLALAWSCAPAAWSAHLLAVQARRRLTTSRGLEEFATSVRPVLLSTFALYLCALTTLLALCTAALNEPAAYAQTLPLGALLLLARLLTIHGFTHAPALALTAAATTEATALTTPFAARLPGCGFLATPVETLANAWGPAGVPTLIGTAAALPLLVHTTRTLTRASSHAPTEQQC